MKRTEIFELIDAERNYQDGKWGTSFDNRNTPNDWVAYITAYAGKAVTLPWDAAKFRTSILKVAALAVAVLERESYEPRHYDKEGLLESFTK